MRQSCGGQPSTTSRLRGEASESAEEASPADRLWPLRGFRRWATAGSAAALWCLASGTALASTGEEWPNFNDGYFERGPGFYLNPVKILAVLFLTWIWMRTTEWISDDTWSLKLNYRMWNPVVVLTYFVAVVLLFLLPWFFVGFPLLLLAYVVPLAVYVRHRNGKVEDHQKVCTREHFKHLIKTRGGFLGQKLAKDKVLPQDKGAPVVFKPGGADEQKSQGAFLLARQSAGFVPLKDLVAAAIDRRAETLVIDASNISTGVSFQIDGALHQQKPLESGVGGGLLHTMRLLAVLNPQERRAKQSGVFGVEYAAHKLEGRLTTQGTETGERGILRLVDGRLLINSMEELGMRGKLLEQLNEVLSRPNGWVLLSALPAGGLTTTFDVLLKTRDRYMREHASVEDAGRREREIENIQVHTYNGAAGETPATVLTKVVRTYPNVIVVRDLPDAETVKFLSQEALDERMILSSIKAKDSTEALLRVLMLNPPVKEFVSAMSAVLNQRLIRKLCEKCRVAYAPSADQLKQLGLPPGKVQKMYSPFVYQPPPAGQKAKVLPCANCSGIGYFGRTAIFELFVLTPEFREALLKTPKMEILRPLARKGGMRTLQEEGVLLVARGVTSAAELARVLKQ